MSAPKLYIKTDLATEEPYSFVATKPLNWGKVFQGEQEHPDCGFREASPAEILAYVSQATAALADLPAVLATLHRFTEHWATGVEVSMADIVATRDHLVRLLTVMGAAPEPEPARRARKAVG